MHISDYRRSPFSWTSAQLFLEATGTGLNLLNLIILVPWKSGGQFDVNLATIGNCVQDAMATHETEREIQTVHVN